MTGRLKALACILATIICVFLFSAAASAESDGYCILIGDSQISDACLYAEGRSGRAEYDPENRTLTLDSLVLDKQIYADVEGELNIRLVGDSVISSDTIYGIFVEGRLNVTAEQGASLEVRAGSGNGAGEDAVAIHANGRISFLSGEIIAVGGSGVETSAGISSYSDIVISGGSITAIGGEADSLSVGIYLPSDYILAEPGASYSIRLSGGTVGAYAGKSENGYGIYCGAELIALGGDIESTGDHAMWVNNLNLTDFPLPEVRVGNDAASAAAWDGKNLDSYAYVSLKSIVSVIVEELDWCDIFVDNIHAAPGEEVSVRVEPKAGYSLDRIVITDASGAEIPFDGESFVMPEDGYAYVSASFKPLDITLTVDDYTDKVQYGYSYGEAYISLALDFDGISDTGDYDVSYTWYDVTGGKEEIVHGEASAMLRLPEGAEIGRYQYLCAVSAIRKDNGKKTSLRTPAIDIEIVRRELDPPEADAREFVYNGEILRYRLPESKLYSVSGAEEIRVGEYTVVVSLADKERYCWRGGSDADLEYSFVINQGKASISLDTDNIEVVFGEEVILPQGSSNLGVVMRDMNGDNIYNVGVYAVKYEVLSTKDYIGDVKTLTVTVKPAVYDVSGITFDDKVFSADGENHSIFIEGELPRGVSVGYLGNGVSEVGEYTVIARFTVDKNHEPIPDMTAKIIIEPSLVPPSEDDEVDDGNSDLDSDLDPDSDPGSDSDLDPDSDKDNDAPSSDGDKEPSGGDNGSSDTSTDGFDGDLDGDLDSDNGGDVGTDDSGDTDRDGDNAVNLIDNYIWIIIAVGSVPAIGAVVAFVVIIAIGRSRDSMWEQYKRRNRSDDNF